MKREAFEEWPTITGENIKASPDGFEPEPERDPLEYIVAKADQEQPPAVVRINTETRPETIDRLGGNLAPEFRDPNRVGNTYAEGGQQSIKPLSSTPYETTNNFMQPAPVRENQKKKSWWRGLFGN